MTFRYSIAIINNYYEVTGNIINYLEYVGYFIILFKDFETTLITWIHFYFDLNFVGQFLLNKFNKSFS